MKNQMARLCRSAIIPQSLGSQALWADYAQDMSGANCHVSRANGQEKHIGQRKVEQTSRNVQFTSSFTIKIKHKKGRLSQRQTTKVGPSASFQVTMGRSNHSCF